MSLNPFWLCWSASPPCIESGLVVSFPSSHWSRACSHGWVCENVPKSIANYLTATSFLVRLGSSLASHSICGPKMLTPLISSSVSSFVQPRFFWCLLSPASTSCFGLLSPCLYLLGELSLCDSNSPRVKPLTFWPVFGWVDYSTFPPLSVILISWIQR